MVESASEELASGGEEARSDNPPALGQSFNKEKAGIANQKRGESFTDKYQQKNELTDGVPVINMKKSYGENLNKGIVTSSSQARAPGHVGNR